MHKLSSYREADSARVVGPQNVDRALGLALFTVVNQHLPRASVSATQGDSCSMPRERRCPIADVSRPTGRVMTFPTIVDVESARAEKEQASTLAAALCRPGKHGLCRD
jgi:hypothetical protein